MQPSVEQTWLFRRLHEAGRKDLAASALRLRERVDTFLRGVHTTFPHYTSHAVDHYDEIVHQLSMLLEGGPASRAMTDIECYLLVCAAYLHDAGMVVTEEEKFKVLGSDDWSRFCASTGRQLSGLAGPCDQG